MFRSVGASPGRRRATRLVSSVSAWKSWVAWLSGGCTVPLGKTVLILGAAWKGGYRPRSYRAGGYAIPFLRSCRGTHPLGRSALSLLRCGEHPRGCPDVASGGYSYPALQLGALRGGAVSSVVTSGCPKRSEGGCPCRNEDVRRPLRKPPSANHNSKTANKYGNPGRVTIDDTPGIPVHY